MSDDVRKVKMLYNTQTCDLVRAPGLPKVLITSKKKERDRKEKLFFSYVVTLVNMVETFPISLPGVNLKRLIFIIGLYFF